MRCIKCGFISFDFNQVCPKCNRELADEQKKMNLPSFRPDPPLLLRRLLGETFDSEIDSHTDHSDILEKDQGTGYDDRDDSSIDLSDSMLPFLDEEELDVVSLEPDDAEPTPASLKNEPENQDLLFSLEDVSLENMEKIPSEKIQENDFLNLLLEDEDTTSKESGDALENDSALEKPDRAPEIENAGMEDLSFNLDDLSFDDLDIAGSANLEEADEHNEIPLPEAAPSEKVNIQQAFYLEDDAEGLTKEIDMKKFRREEKKGEKKSQ
jgi:hypothetical protein